VRLVFAAIALAFLAMPASAHATFPGSNGKIAVVRDGNIWTMNPDGSGLRQMTTSGVDDVPSWSADGQKIAFASRRDGDSEIYSVDVSTGTQTRLTNDPASDYKPTWSPDGRKIAFARSEPAYEIYVMNADGTGVTSLTAGQGGAEPDWSPDGRKIAFTFFDDTQNIYLMNVDGTGRTPLTKYGPGSRNGFWQARRPDWSPDGARIVFELSYGGIGFFGNNVTMINANGGNPTDVVCCNEYQPVFSPDGRLVLFISGGGYTGCEGFCVVPSDPPHSPVTKAGGTGGSSADWQPGPAGAPTPSGFPHPASASQVRVSLVPAYQQCVFPSDRHGPPLGWQSCNPARTASDYLTVGTPDANGHAAKASGWVSYDVIADDTRTAADEADVRIGLKVTDVRRKSDLSDYTGEIWTLVSQQITDLNNPGSLGNSGTMEEQQMVVTAPCGATTDSSIGATCQVSTTVDTLIPGAIPGGDQAVWELNRVEVYDGGADGRRDTGPNTLFMQQGVFVP
jgi:WD40 repeat protein